MAGGGSRLRPRRPLKQPPSVILLEFAARPSKQAMSRSASRPRRAARESSRHPPARRPMCGPPSRRSHTSQLLWPQPMLRLHDRRRPRSGMPCTHRQRCRASDRPTLGESSLTGSPRPGAYMLHTLGGQINFSRPYRFHTSIFGPTHKCCTLALHT